MTRRRAWTLIEAVVVIGIFGMLVGLLLPAVQASRDAVGRAGCLNRMRQLGVALHSYHASRGSFPPEHRDLTAQDPCFALTWRVFLLPEMGEEPLWSEAWQAFQQDRVAWHNPPHVGYATVVRSYVCPADGRLLKPLKHPASPPAGFTSFLGVAGSTDGMFDGVLGHVPAVRLDEITDGTSQTLMVGERPPPDSLQAGRWYAVGVAGDVDRWTFGPDIALTVSELPNLADPACPQVERAFSSGRTSDPCDRYHFWSLHRGGANFLFADGSAKFLPYSPFKVMKVLATRADGDSIEP